MENKVASLRKIPQFFKCLTKLLKEPDLKNNQVLHRIYDEAHEIWFRMLYDLSVLRLSETKSSSPNWRVYLFKFDNRNNRTMYKIYSKLAVKIPEQRNWRRSGVFIVNFEQILHSTLKFSLLNFNK